jgi:primosomal protein N'
LENAWSLNSAIRRRIGYIVGFSDKAEVPSVKDIKSVIDDVPIVFPEMMELCRWISDSYLCSWGEAYTRPFLRL